MRATHDLLQLQPQLGHVNFSLCDSHGQQLLIKDTLTHPFFADLMEDVEKVLTFFSRSALQLSRLCECQRARWAGVMRALIRSVITRWGSQFNSFESITRNRVPLRDWSALPEVQQQLREKDYPVFLPEVIRIVRSSAFWEKLEMAMAMIQPVHVHQVCLCALSISPCFPAKNPTDAYFFSAACIRSRQRQHQLRY